MLMVGIWINFTHPYNAGGYLPTNSMAIETELAWGGSLNTLGEKMRLPLLDDGSTTAVVPSPVGTW